MENSDTFEINEVGNISGLPYSGTFKAKTLLTRQDRFRADEERRRVLGVDAGNAMGGLQGEALMLGQIAVRVLDGPEWFKNSRNLLELPDDNIVGVIFAGCMKVESERYEKIQKKAAEALAGLKADDTAKAEKEKNEKEKAAK